MTRRGMSLRYLDSMTRRHWLSTLPAGLGLASSSSAQRDAAKITIRDLEVFGGRLAGHLARVAVQKLQPAAEEPLQIVELPTNSS